MQLPGDALDQGDPGQRQSGGPGDVADERAKADADEREGAAGGDPAGEGLPGACRREMEGPALGRPPGGGGGKGGGGRDKPGGRAGQSVDGQLRGDDPPPAGEAEEGVGDRAVPVLARDGQDAEDQGEYRRQADVRQRPALDGRIVHVRAGEDQAGDPGHDDHRAGGEQQPWAADGGELAELGADLRRHVRPPWHGRGHGRSLDGGPTPVGRPVVSPARPSASETLIPVPGRTRQAHAAARRSGALPR